LRLWKYDQNNFIERSFNILWLKIENLNELRKIGLQLM
jgi:hypothetical protein